MNTKIIELILKLLAVVFVVGQLHGFFKLDDCLDLGGVFIEETGNCSVGNDQIDNMKVTPPMVVIYVVVGLLVYSLLSAIFKAANLIQRFTSWLLGRNGT